MTRSPLLQLLEDVHARAEALQRAASHRERIATVRLVNALEDALRAARQRVDQITARDLASYEPGVAEPWEDAA